MNLLKYEKSLWKQGIRLVVGIDEAGRGPLAGPMVVAAVILNPKIFIKKRDYAKSNPFWYKINDSKKLSAKKREKLYDFILNESMYYSIIKINEKVLDEHGMSKATQIGFEKVVKNLGVAPEHFLTDFFTIKGIDTKLQTNITKGDSKSMSIAAASILAKVYRDRLMIKMHKRYPQYGFNRHKGYGTKKHKEAIHKFGLCEIHRKSFNIS